ncbi:MAG TPA: potassium channel protein [Anaerolineae bacterium]|nr:potassium channel protein [Anaerolineae bacterium]
MGIEEVRSLRQRLGFVLVAVVCVLVVGTVGYRWIEGWAWIDALYMTMITVSTVGFGETYPLSVRGRLFTMCLLIVGVVIATYGIGTATEYLIFSDLGGRLRRRRMAKELSQMTGHVIVCGYGRVGENAVNGLMADQKRPIVIIENNHQFVVELRDAGHMVVEGDATHDDILTQAGIERAWGLLVCTGSDPDNLFIVLSARSMSKSLRIVVRSSDPGNEPKMMRAGANRVVSPYKIGGRRMVNLMLRPHVTEFMDVVTLDNGLEFWLEELVISPNSPLVGQSVFEADIRRRTGVTLVGVLRQSNELRLSVDLNLRLEAGDELIVLGTREQLGKLEALVGGQLVE